MRDDFRLPSLSSSRQRMLRRDLLFTGGDSRRVFFAGLTARLVSVELLLRSQEEEGVALSGARVHV